MAGNKKTSLVVRIFKIFFDVISWIALAILLFVAAFLIYYVINVKVYENRGEEYKAPVSLFTIISPSMEPNIKVYDVILTTKVTDSTDLKVGDVITFKSSSSISEGLTVTHRIAEVIDNEEGIKYRTKGDNNESPDSALVVRENIVGKVLFKIPQLGRVQEFLSNKKGWFIGIVIPAFLIIIYDIFKVVRLNVIKKKVESVINEKEMVDPKKIELENARKKFIQQKLSEYVEPSDDELIDVSPLNEIINVGNVPINTPETKVVTKAKLKKSLVKKEATTNIDLPTIKIKKAKTPDSIELPTIK